MKVLQQAKCETVMFNFHCRFKVVVSPIKNNDHALGYGVELMLFHTIYLANTPIYIQPTHTPTHHCASTNKVTVIVPNHQWLILLVLVGGHRF